LHFKRRLSPLASKSPEWTNHDFPVGQNQEALRIAEGAVEELLCNSRLISEICRALGCDDPEGVAPLVNTTGLMASLGPVIVADVVRAGRESLSAHDFPEFLRIPEN
jgi:hypothetical protein